MPNDSQAAKVICPYFVRYEGVLEIVCEGLAPGVQTAMRFPCQGKRSKWAEEHCNGFDYGSCPLAAIHDSK